MSKYVYFFGGGKADGNKDMKDTLGGKGAGLAEMTNAGLPVPPGFTLSTDACHIYSEKGSLPQSIEDEFDAALAQLESLVGQKLGDPDNPLLLSVRSGAKFSMPGMMDTVLNLGMNDTSVEGLGKAAGERFAWDSYRRFLQMFGDVVLEVGKPLFEEVLEEIKKAKGASTDTDLSAEDLKEVVVRFKALVKDKTGKDFPMDAREQLRMSRDAVFKSWDNPRAIEYRRIYHISHDLGTAVNVQKMVFGNLGDKSATGVGFTRDPGSGAKEFFGEFLMNAQGEDVVAGIRTPMLIVDMEKELPEAYQELRDITDRLEHHYKDVQDFEFTVEEGHLYMLQTRSGKRTGLAAVKIATDMVEEGIITEREALKLVEPDALEQLLHPIFDPKERRKYETVAKGIAASPGAACGQVVFEADDAVRWTKEGKRVLLVRMETSPDDVHGMKVSQGILTATGGRTSHAAVVGRQMGKPAVVGCGAININAKAKTFEVGGKVVKEGDTVSIDGTLGEVVLAEVPTAPSEVIQVVQGKMKPEESDMYQRVDRLLKWADKERRLGVRTNADDPKNAGIAVAFGAEGIGLCRTEHMFFAEDRLPLMQKTILASTDEDRQPFLDQLAPMQKEDFVGLFRVMSGMAVTIRTLDPPLHEFLPKREDLMTEIATLEATGGDKDRLAERKTLLARVEQLHEFNPMLGHRGCRLGITYQALTEMQARAIFEAACEVAKEGKKPMPEVMIPLVGIDKELIAQHAIVEKIAKETIKKAGVEIDYKIGTMIEVPRGALTAGEIAKTAEFFSFGTNDLTQMTFGFSRDDVGKFLPAYIEQGILERDPFDSIDVKGVGQLVESATENGRKTRPDLKVGICGEHGGDPDSIRFFHKVGLNYVSASPYQVPIARLAAARAVLEEQEEDLTGNQ
jgi:pyruvate,orthophosphate dikinase